MELRVDGNSTPVESYEEVALDDNLKHTTRVGTSLSPELKAKLIKFLRINKDVFARTSSNMPGIDPDVIVDKSNLLLYNLKVLNAIIRNLRKFCLVMVLN